MHLLASLQADPSSTSFELGVLFGRLLAYVVLLTIPALAALSLVKIFRSERKGVWVVLFIVSGGLCSLIAIALLVAGFTGFREGYLTGMKAHTVKTVTSADGTLRVEVPGTWVDISDDEGLASCQLALMGPAPADEQVFFYPPEPRVSGIPFSQYYGVSFSHGEELLNTQISGPFRIITIGDYQYVEQVYQSVMMDGQLRTYWLGILETPDSHCRVMFAARATEESIARTRFDKVLTSFAESHQKRVARLPNSAGGTILPTSSKDQSLPHGISRW